MLYEIEYWSNNASDAHPLVLTVAAPANASLTVGSNGDTPGSAPVGIFAAGLPPASVDPLLRAATALAAPAAAIGPANPGELVRRLTASVEGQPPIARTATESSPADPAFEAAEREALALAALVRQHPKLALSVVASFGFGAGGSVDIAVKLTNVGVDPVCIPHPDQWTDQPVLVNVTARRNDVPLAQLRNEHQVFLELSRDRLAGVTPTQAAAPTITIAPRQDVTFKFSAILKLTAGSYDVWLACDTPLLDAKGNVVLRAELVSAKQPRQVD